MMTMFGNGWAQPVVSKPWAFVATILHALCRLSGYHVFVHAKAHAWERACGLKRDGSPL
jgi:hypothetical protein